MPDVAAPARAGLPPPPAVVARAWGDLLFRLLCQGAAVLSMIVPVPRPR